MRPAAPTGLLAVAVVIAACGDDASPPVVHTATLGGFVVNMTERPARMTVLSSDGRVLFDGLPGDAAPSDVHAAPRTGLAVRAAKATYEFAVGSFKIEDKPRVPWRAASRMTDVVATPEEIRFRLADAAGEPLADAVLVAEDAGALAITITATDPATNRVSIGFACDPEEHFLGLGGQSFDVDHRGQTVPIWVQEDGIGKAATDDYGDGVWILNGRRHSTHTPMPITLSSRGAALLLDTPARSLFALCSEGQKDFARIEAWEGVLRLHLFDGPTPKEAIRRLTQFTGRPTLPPPFAFAPWLDAIYGSDNVRRVAEKLRALDIPSSVIWTEDWRGAKDDGIGYTLDEDWDVDRALYPDFEALAGELHAAGFKFLTYNNTFLVSKLPVYDEAVAGGHTIRNAAGAPYLFQGATFQDTSLVDLSSPAAVTWTKQKYGDGLRLGADGYMADFAEWLPTDAILSSGMSAELRHNLYPVDYQRLNKELLDELHAQDGVDRLFFVRSAYLGSQPLVSVVWAGDQQTDFSAGDGFPSVIPIGIGLGVTGFPYFGHDIGGYMSALTTPTTRELWLRWASLGALSPIMRTHHGKSARQNWTWESDEESTTHLRRWAKLHNRLFPYLYALAKEAADTGVPMMRPLALEHPELAAGWTMTDEFLLGDRIVVAPVVTEGATSRDVTLPAGTFYPLEGGEAATVGADGTIHVEAPVTELPAFVPAGTLLALLPDDVDTLVAAKPASGAVTLADVGDNRELWLWPGGESQLTEASGLSYAWSAAMLTTPVTAASWNGADTPVENGLIHVAGAGTLVVNGVATLTVTGGAAERKLVVQVR